MATSERHSIMLKLRDPKPGDYGWVIHRQAVLYAEEYGWNNDYEALIAGIIAEIHRRFDPARERIWIAERDGEVVGSVFLVAGEGTVAKLRLLYVDPSCRGQGLGKRLVKECVTCARERGYSKMTLWTQSNLHAARGIYKSEGFQLVKSEPHRSFGVDLVGEIWELTL